MSSQPRKASLIDDPSHDVGLLRSFLERMFDARALPRCSVIPAQAIDEKTARLDCSAFERIARMLAAARQTTSKQLFGLVDVIYACKSIRRSCLLGQAKLVEQALGNLGSYLETGDTNALDFAALPCRGICAILSTPRLAKRLPGVNHGRNRASVFDQGGEHLQMPGTRQR